MNVDLLTLHLGGHIPIYLLVIIITGLAAGAFFLGVRVQSTVHFIWPKDVFSLLIYSVCIIDLVVIRGFIDINAYEIWFWLPIIAAYLIGFVFSSNGCYIMLATPILSTQKISVSYIVPYWVEDEQYIQEQKNKALLKRLIFGIEHKIICNIRLEPNWEFTLKHPYFPIPKVPALLVDSIIDEDPVIVREDKWIKCIQFVTEIQVAPASLKSKMDMMMIEQAHERDVSENIRLSAELLRVKQLAYRESMASAIDTLNYATVDATPGMQIIKHMQSEKLKPNKARGDEE